MKILDVTCGARSMWYQKNHPFVTYMDIRNGKFAVGGGKIKNRRNWVVKPDIIADFRKTPFNDNEFDLIVFDPPFHIRKQNTDSWIKNKYGILLSKEWKDTIKKSFIELFRILKESGVLIFKWSDINIKNEEIIKLSPYPPMFGTRSGKDNNTIWILFIKYNPNKTLDGVGI